MSPPPPCLRCICLFFVIFASRDVSTRNDLIDCAPSLPPQTFLRSLPGLQNSSIRDPPPRLHRWMWRTLLYLPLSVLCTAKTMIQTHVSHAHFCEKKLRKNHKYQCVLKVQYIRVFQFVAIAVLGMLQNSGR